MDDIIVRNVMFDPEAVIAISIFALLAGGVLGWLTWRAEWRLRRVTYFVVEAALLLALSLAQLIWLALPAAVASGQLSALFLAAMGTILAGGYATWVAAAARSRHIGSDTSRAWLAFVPIANLYLFFRSGETDRNRAPPERRISRALADIALVFVGLVLLMLGNAVTRELGQTLESDEIWTEATADSLLAQLSPEEAAREISAAMQGDLPIRVNETTEVVGISARGRVLFCDSASRQTSMQSVRTSQGRWNRARAKTSVPCLPTASGSFSTTSVPTAMFSSIMR